MTTEDKAKVVRVCRDLKKPCGSRMAGSHARGGWDTRKVSMAMDKHGLHRRFRPDVMDGLGADFMPGRVQTTDRSDPRRIENLVNDSE